VLSEWIAAVEKRLGEAAGAVSPASSSSSISSTGPSLEGEAPLEAAAEDPLIVDGLLKVGESLRIKEARGGEVVVTHVAGTPRNVFERVDAGLWGLQRRVRSVLGLGRQREVRGA